MKKTLLMSLLIFSFSAVGAVDEPPKCKYKFPIGITCKFVVDGPEEQFTLAQFKADPRIPQSIKDEIIAQYNANPPHTQKAPVKRK